MTCGRKRIRRGVTDAQANCNDCGWEVSTRNALGLAAQHHDRTGHLVRAHETWGVTYGTPEALAALEGKP